jgi:hypothetical protein
MTTKMITCLDKYLEKNRISEIDAVKANGILDKAGILKDSASCPGLPLRKKLRSGEIPHAYQINGKCSRWWIPHSCINQSLNINNMKNNFETILAEFKKNKFDPITDEKTKIKDLPGNYIICLRKNVKFSPERCPTIKFKTFNEYRVLYVGKSGKLRTRDYKNHFGNNAGSSTLRKSLGVLFGYTLVPRDKKSNDKTKFNKTDEEKLTEWMKENLIIYFYPVLNHNENEVEEELIQHFNPPLNLRKNINSINKEFRKCLSSLRLNKNK